MKTIAEMREILRGCPQCGRRRATEDDYYRECEPPGTPRGECEPGACWCQNVCWEGAYCDEGDGSAHERLLSHVALLVDVAEAAEKLAPLGACNDDCCENNERHAAAHEELSKALAVLNAALESDS